jgi:hypothetical protein
MPDWMRPTPQPNNPSQLRFSRSALAANMAIALSLEIGTPCLARHSSTAATNFTSRVSLTCFASYSFRGRPIFVLYQSSHEPTCHPARMKLF